MARASESLSEEGRFSHQAALRTQTIPAAIAAGFQPMKEPGFLRRGATHSPAARPTRMLAVISADRRSQFTPAGISAAACFKL
jgi:hypothetical protein